MVSSQGDRDILYCFVHLLKDLHYEYSLYSMNQRCCWNSSMTKEYGSIYRTDNDRPTVCLIRDDMVEFRFVHISHN